MHCLASVDSWMKGEYNPIHQGKCDAAFRIAGKDFGFDLENTPFGSDNFDLVSDVPSPYSYAEIFTGMVYYKPVTEFICLWGIPGILSDGFDVELARRYAIFGDSKMTLRKIKRIYKDTDIETYKQHYPRFNRVIKKNLQSLSK